MDEQAWLESLVAATPAGTVAGALVQVEMVRRVTERDRGEERHVEALGNALDTLGRLAARRA